MIRTEIDSMPAELDEVTRRVMRLEIEEAALKKEKDKASQAAPRGAAQGAGRPARRGRRHARPVGGRAAGASSKVQALREEIEQVRREVEEAERSYDLNRAAELRYGQLPELERQLQPRRSGSTSQAGRAAGCCARRSPRRRSPRSSSRWTGIPVTRLRGGRAREAAAARRDPARAGDRPGRGGAAGRRRGHPRPLRDQGPAPADRLVHLPRARPASARPSWPRRWPRRCSTPRTTWCAST